MQQRYSRTAVGLYGKAACTTTLWLWAGPQLPGCQAPGASLAGGSAQCSAAVCASSMWSAGHLGSWRRGVVDEGEAGQQQEEEGREWPAGLLRGGKRAKQGASDGEGRLGAGCKAVTVRAILYAVAVGCGAGRSLRPRLSACVRAHALLVVLQSTCLPTAAGRQRQQCFVVRAPLRGARPADAGGPLRCCRGAGEGEKGRSLGARHTCFISFISTSVAWRGDLRMQACAGGVEKGHALPWQFVLHVHGVLHGCWFQGQLGQDLLRIACIVVLRMCFASHMGALLGMQCAAVRMIVLSTGVFFPPNDHDAVWGPCHAEQLLCRCRERLTQTTAKSRSSGSGLTLWALGREHTQRGGDPKQHASVSHSVAERLKMSGIPAC